MEAEFLIKGNLYLYDLRILLIYISSKKYPDSSDRANYLFMNPKTLEIAYWTYWSIKNILPAEVYE